MLKVYRSNTHWIKRVVIVIFLIMKGTGESGQEDVVVSVDTDDVGHQKTVNFTDSTLDEFTKKISMTDSSERFVLTGEEKKKKLALAMESMKIISDESETDKKPDEVSLDEHGEVTFKSRLRHLSDKMFLLWETNPAAHQLFPSSQSVKVEKQRQKDMNRYIVHPYSIFRCWWDFGVVFVLFVTMIVLPVEVAFYSDDLWDTKWKAFNLIIDVAFMCDIMVNFRTGFIEEDITIIDNKRIIFHYLKTWFTTDLISSIPFDYIVLSISNNNEEEGNSVLAGTLRALRMVKFISLLRILRFVRLIRYLDKVKEFWHIDAKVLSIVKLIMLILGFAHWNACIQYMVAFIQGFPPYSWVVIADLQHDNVTVWSRYTHALYRGMSHMISIGYGKTAPHGDHETWLVIMSMMMGASFYALFIAHMSSVVMNLNTSGRMFQEKVCEVRDYMKYRRMPSKLQQRVLDYYEYKYQQKYFDEDSILNEKHMSYPLRKEILMHNCRSLVESVPFLANAPSEFLVEVILKLNMHIFFPGELIVQAGKKGDSMFFIEHGSVNIRLPTGEVVNTLRDGSHFGEISLLFEEKRIADVLAIEMCYIYRLSKADFEEVLTEYPKMRKVMLNVARERMRETQARLGMDLDAYVEKIRSVHLVDNTESILGTPSYERLLSEDPSFHPRNAQSAEDDHEEGVDTDNSNQNNNNMNDQLQAGEVGGEGARSGPRVCDVTATNTTTTTASRDDHGQQGAAAQPEGGAPRREEQAEGTDHCPSLSPSDQSLSGDLRRRHLCPGMPDVSI